MCESPHPHKLESETDRVGLYLSGIPTYITFFARYLDYIPSATASLVRGLSLYPLNIDARTDGVSRFVWSRGHAELHQRICTVDAADVRLPGRNSKVFQSFLKRNGYHVRSSV